MGATQSSGSAQRTVLTSVAGAAVLLLILLGYVWISSPAQTPKRKILLKRFKDLKESHFAYVGIVPPEEEGSMTAETRGSGGRSKGTDGSDAESKKGSATDEMETASEPSIGGDLPSANSKKPSGSSSTKTSSHPPEAMKNDGEQDDEEENEAPIITLFTSQMTSNEQ